MKRLFFDTNIILDFLIREEYQQDIRSLILKSSGMELYVSYLTIANTAYILRKYPKNEIVRYLKLILDIFTVVPNNVNQIQEALKVEVPDFEDMLQYQTALFSKCDVIITRNVKDFPFSVLPVMTVQQFLSR